jgi:hypothetical protein
MEKADYTPYYRWEIRTFYFGTHGAPGALKPPTLPGKMN